jgi:hypothetical protein
MQNIPNLIPQTLKSKHLLEAQYFIINASSEDFSARVQFFWYNSLTWGTVNWRDKCQLFSPHP